MVANSNQSAGTFFKETMRNGRFVQIGCVEIDGQVYSISPGLFSLIGLDDDWYEDVRDPEAVIDALKRNRDIRPDIFMFWQRLPDSTPRFGYHMEWDSVAALPVSSYADWWNNQASSTVRRHVRKSEKAGVVIKETSFTDDFVRGMVDVFNETPVRQNRPFWHYGKDFDTVKREFSRNLFRERLIGAYYRDELIGFVMLADAGNYAVLAQIISKVQHRDKAPNHALVAKAVELCAERQIPHLVYAHWPTGPLAEFKKQNGFEKVDLPRYYVPLTPKGRLILKCNAHHGWKEAVPESVKVSLRRLRKSWYDYRAGRVRPVA